MTSFGNGWLPDEIFAGLMFESHKEDFSYRELELYILRKWLEMHGHKCAHRKNKIKFTKSDKTPYCSKCYARLEKVKVLAANSSSDGIMYREIATPWDREFNPNTWQQVFKGGDMR